jgi:murein endopeptidase
VTVLVPQRDSVAHGSPNGGWLENGVLLPVRGPGYYTYNPATQEPPGGPLRRWGTARLVRELLSATAWWAQTHPEAPRLGIGDLSLKGGGPFVTDHASHQNGLDVDIRLPRRDGVEGPANPATYDRELTQQLVDRFVAQGANLVLIGPSLDLAGPGGVVIRWPNHDDHLHVRFPDPDGAN